MTLAATKKMLPFNYAIPGYQLFIASVITLHHLPINIRDSPFVIDTVDASNVTSGYASLAHLYIYRYILGEVEAP